MISLNDDNKVLSACLHPAMRAAVQKETLKIIIAALQHKLDNYDTAYALSRKVFDLQYEVKDKTEKMERLVERNKEILTKEEKEKEALKEKAELLDYKLDKVIQALADANKMVKWYKEKKRMNAEDYPSKDKFYSLGSTNPWHIRRYLNTITKKP